MGSNVLYVAALLAHGVTKDDHDWCYIYSVRNQGSYRNLNVVFQTFPGQNYFLFQTFRGTLFIFM